MKVGDLIRWVGDTVGAPGKNGEPAPDHPDSCLGIILKVIQIEDLPSFERDEVNVYFVDGCLETHPMIDLVIINESR